jgi:hypothetical protein
MEASQATVVSFRGWADCLEQTEYPTLEYRRLVLAEPNESQQIFSSRYAPDHGYRLGAAEPYRNKAVRLGFSQALPSVPRTRRVRQPCRSLLQRRQGRRFSRCLSCHPVRWLEENGADVARPWFAEVLHEISGNQ